MKRHYEIARQITALRHDLGLSQREFGKTIGVSQQQVVKWENADSGYSLASLEKIADRLGLEITVKFSSRAAPSPPGSLKVRKIPIRPEEEEEIKANIEWFSKLSPLRRLRAVESLNRFTRRLLDASREFRRSD
ncbi:MAG: helix-turn-helix transcriptional regulator [Candidatus Euphemobacter frigidus]|nr:helix-turn-helix transcriptional regulator [Candidatus Euphemobacter frigidus]MDP8276088.1 helix-turn-helix transcriptional regulator [Candidatus Euphemobacter frigidus]